MSTLKVGTIQDHTNSNTAINIDSGGRILQPQKPHFHVAKTNGAVGASTTILWNSVIRDTESGYNASTGIYTIPTGLTGLWWFGANALANNTTYVEITLKVGAVGTFNARNQGQANTNTTASFSAAYYATAGDELLIRTESGSSLYGSGNQYSFWTGYFIG